jgi:hypothetical protein
VCLQVSDYNTNIILLEIKHHLNQDYHEIFFFLTRFPTMTDVLDNVVYLTRRHIDVPTATVPAVCGVAAKIMESAVIVGTAADGSIKMMTTINDTAEILRHLDAARHHLLSVGSEN